MAKWLSAKNFESSESQISIDNIFQECSQIFLDFFEVSCGNKMIKYGPPGAEKSRNHGILRF